MTVVARVEILTPTEYTDRGFQTALWWEKVLLMPGEYEVVPWSNIEYYNHFKVPCTTIEDFFASNFAGCSIQPYDTKRNEGKEGYKWMGFPARYELAKDDTAINSWLARHPEYRLIERCW